MEEREFRRREIQEADTLKVLATLEGAFNQALRANPPRPSSGMVEMQEWFIVSGGEKGYQNGGEVVPVPRKLFVVSLSFFSEVLSRTDRSSQGRAVVGRGEANP